MHLFENKYPRNIWLLHGISWVIYILLELLSFKYFYGSFRPVYDYVYGYAINIGWFYAILWALKFPVERRAHRFFIFLVRWISLIITFFGLKFIGYYILGDKAGIASQLERPVTFFVTNFYRGSVFAFLAIFYYLAGYLARYRQRTLEAENSRLVALKEKAEIEIRLSESKNAFLQQQLNPHLLFNTLNFVYSKVFKHSADGAKAVELLADILRYSLDQDGSDKATGLNNEIQQIQNLIAINAFRFDAPLCLSVAINGDFKRHQFIPLVLLTLTENMFKHGNLRDSKHPASLQITITDAGELTYQSFNIKKTKSAEKRINSIGLKNIKTRLDFAYPENYQLIVDETEMHFNLILKLVL